jgi:hypothetical protein
MLSLPPKVSISPRVLLFTNEASVNEAETGLAPCGAADAGAGEAEGEGDAAGDGLLSLPNISSSREFPAARPLSWWTAVKTKNTIGKIFDPRFNELYFIGSVTPAKPW